MLQQSHHLVLRLKPEKVDATQHVQRRAATRDLPGREPALQEASNFLEGRPFPAEQCRLALRQRAVVSARREQQPQGTHIRLSAREMNPTREYLELPIKLQRGGGSNCGILTLRHRRHRLTRVDAAPRPRRVVTAHAAHAARDAAQCSLERGRKPLQQHLGTQILARAALGERRDGELAAQLGALPPSDHQLVRRLAQSASWRRVDPGSDEVCNRLQRRSHPGRAGRLFLHRRGGKGCR